jgi:hypothetical protein
VCFAPRSLHLLLHDVWSDGDHPFQADLTKQWESATTLRWQEQTSWAPQTGVLVVPAQATYCKQGTQGRPVRLNALGRIRHAFIFHLAESRISGARSDASRVISAVPTLIPFAGKVAHKLTGAETVVS